MLEESSRTCRSRARRCASALSLALASQKEMMYEKSHIPVSLKVVAVLFILGGIHSVIEVVLDLMQSKININFGVLGLFIGPGLLALRRGWRTCALVFTWIALIFLPILTVIMFFWVRLSLYLPQLAMTADINPNISFQMTRGNVWRIIGLYLLTFIAMFAIMIFALFFFAALFMAAIGFDFSDFASAIEGQDFEALNAWMMETFWGPQGLILAVPYLLLAIYLTGFSLALPAYMYRDLQEN